MSMDQFPDALTWGSPCQWTKHSIIHNHWHGASHVNGPDIQYFPTTDMGSPCQWTNFWTHWHGIPMPPLTWSAWKLGFINLWIFECLKSKCLKTSIRNVWIFECLNVWKYVRRLNFWMFEIFECFNVWMFQFQPFKHSRVWIPQTLKHSKLK